MNATAKAPLKMMVVHVMKNVVTMINLVSAKKDIMGFFVTIVMKVTFPAMEMKQPVQVTKHYHFEYLHIYGNIKF